MGIFQHEISVSRLTNTTGIKYDYASQGGEYPCSIQPINDTTAITLGYALGKTFKIYIPDAEVDALISDKVLDNDGLEYTIKGVKRYRQSNGVGHTELTAELID